MNQFLEHFLFVLKTTKTLLLTIHNLAAHSHDFAENILTSDIWPTKPQPCHTQSRICWGHLDRSHLTCSNLSSLGRNYVGSLFTTEDQVKKRWLLTFDTFATPAGLVYDLFVCLFVCCSFFHCGIRVTQKVKFRLMYLLWIINLVCICTGKSRDAYWFDSPLTNYRYGHVNKQSYNSNPTPSLLFPPSLTVPVILTGSIPL